MTIVDYITTIPWYAVTSLIFLIIVCILILLYKRGVIVDWGAKKLIFVDKNESDKYEIYEVKFQNILSDVIDLTCEIIITKTITIINEQMRLVDTMLFVIFGDINNLLTEELEKKVVKMKEMPPDFKLEWQLRDNRIINNIFLIHQQDYHNFLKTSLLENHFIDKSPIELKEYCTFKTNVLFVKFEERIRQLYPDCKEMLFEKQELINIIKSRVFPIISENVYKLIMNCQSIQKNYDEKIKKLEKTREERKSELRFNGKNKKNNG